MAAQLAQGDIRTFSQLSPVLLYALRRLSKAQLADLGEVREGLENPLYRACREAATMEELLTLVKTRRYPMARLKRACLCAAWALPGRTWSSCPRGSIAGCWGCGGKPCLCWPGYAKPPGCL